MSTHTHTHTHTHIHTYDADLCIIYILHFLQVRPLVDGRSRCGYVGLKNAGATCYMNSVLQQLYMQPGIKEAVLGIEREEDDVRYIIIV